MSEENMVMSEKDNLGKGRRKVPYCEHCGKIFEDLKKGDPCPICKVPLTEKSIVE